MNEVHLPMTGLEEKFEEELGHTPPKPEPTEAKESRQKAKETKADRAVEEAMHLNQ